MVDGIAAGRLLTQGAWNSELFGPLKPLQAAGAKAGTDLWFNKSKTANCMQLIKSPFTDILSDRQSGLWGAQTPLGLWLEENQITTLFLGGVNTDQCVVSVVIDNHNRASSIADYSSGVLLLMGSTKAMMWC